MANVDKLEKFKLAALGLNDLLKLTFDNYNSIEEGLRRPENQELFLSASLAFLQNYYLNKLNSKLEELNGKKQCSVQTDCDTNEYSDSLCLLNVTEEGTDISMVKLKDHEEHYRKFKSEASVCERALDQNQLTPEPLHVKNRRDDEKPTLEFDVHKIVLPRNTQTVINVFDTEDECSKPTDNQQTYRPRSDYFNLPTETLTLESDDDRVAGFSVQIFAPRTQAASHYPLQSVRGVHDLCSSSNLLNNEGTNLRRCPVNEGSLILRGQKSRISRSVDDHYRVFSSRDEWLNYIQHPMSTNLTDEIKSHISSEDIRSYYEHQPVEESRYYLC